MAPGAPRSPVSPGFANEFEVYCWFNDDGCIAAADADAAAAAASRRFERNAPSPMPVGKV